MPSLQTITTDFPLVLSFHAVSHDVNFLKGISLKCFSFLFSFSWDATATKDRKLNFICYLFSPFPFYCVILKWILNSFCFRWTQCYLNLFRLWYTWSSITTHRLRKTGFTQDGSFSFLFKFYFPSAGKVFVLSGSRSSLMIIFAFYAIF